MNTARNANQTAQQKLRPPLLIGDIFLEGEASAEPQSHQGTLAPTHTGTLSAEANMGPLTSLRYDLWRSLSCELEVSREWAAIAYYKLRGGI